MARGDAPLPIHPIGAATAPSTPGAERSARRAEALVTTGVIEPAMDGADERAAIQGSVHVGWTRQTPPSSEPSAAEPRYPRQHVVDRPGP